MPCLQIGRRLVGPAEARKGEQARREPRVEHVLVLRERELLRPATVLFERCLARLRLGRRHVYAHVDAVDLGKVRWDAVAPPELARDAPVLDVVKEVEPHLLRLLGQDGQLAVAHCVRGALCHPGAIDPPLGLEDWLDDVTSPAADGDGHCVILLAAEEPKILERLEHSHARVEAHHALKLSAISRHLTLISEDRDLLEAVTAAALEIIRVVRGRDLDRARPEAHVDEHRVRHDRDLAWHEGMNEEASVELLVPRIVWVNCHRGVAEHRLGTRRRDDHFLVRALDLVRKRPDHAEDIRIELVAGHLPLGALGDRLLVNLQIGDDRLQRAAPVGEAHVAVDDLVLVELQERRLHRARARRVHREHLA